MPDIRAVLRAHARRYPEMEPCDAVKLLYQSANGGGHLMKDPQAGLRRLEEEMAALPPGADGPLAEDIGGGFFRLHLAAARREGLSARTVNALFALSSLPAPGGALEGLLQALEGLTAQGEMPFAPDRLDAYLAQYRREGCPMAGHSSRYRACYQPAYRVVAARYEKLLPLFCAVDARLGETGRLSVAIDGRCGSGKTTLAALLEKVYPARIVHMDDFFLPLSLRTPERLAQPGGNVHFERFMEEAAEGIRTGEPFSHRVYDCAQGGYAGARTLPSCPLTVVEGAYCMRPEMEGLYGLTVFLDIDPQEQAKRIEARNGEQGLRVFREKWIPLEERYFSALRVRERCGIVL